LFLSALGQAQQPQAENIGPFADPVAGDTMRVKELLDLSSKSFRSSPEEAIRYGMAARALADQLDYKTGMAYAFKSIGMGYYFKGDYIEALINWQQSLSTFQLAGDKMGVANMLNNLGAVHFNEGDDTKAIEYYLESLRVSEEIGDKLRIATALVNIGAVYFNKAATHDLALKYYSRALPLSEELGDVDAIGTSAVNIGEIYLENNDYDSALYFFNKSLQAYARSENGNISYTLNNIGKVYARKGDYAQAILKQQEALALAEKVDARLEMAQSLLGLADTYTQKGDIGAAIASYSRAMEISKVIGTNYELKSAFEGLALSYSRIGDFRNAFQYHALYSSIKDTLYNAEMDKRLQAMTLNFEIDKKQGRIDLLEKDRILKEVDLQRQKAIRNATGITGILLLLLAGGLFNRYRYVRRTKKIIEDEKERSERLLLNILPVETAEELKAKGSATPKHYDMVSVLFTDFKGFTNIAEKLTPQELVAELNRCFFEFDKIIDKYGLEKIKTIGDAYMCAGGIPVANTTHPIDITHAALEIRQFMEDLKQERAARGEDYWELRMGIHTGPVVAGVVGKNKFAYDIWGDAVNTASRMESSGIPGKVNISGATYELIRDYFVCQHRGKVQAKNKGEIDMYIVESPVGRANKEERIDSLSLNQN
jgi:class 3 adenylate cyclase/Tfp pilus assembly protein PilF